MNMKTPIILLLLFSTLLTVSASAFDYEVTVWDCDPPNLDMRAIRVIGRGVEMNISGTYSADENHSFILYCFLTDSSDDHNLKAWTTIEVTSTPTLYTLGKDTLDFNSSYFLFVGVPIGTYTTDNTGFISDDGSVMVNTFSTAGYDKGSDVSIGTGEANDYIGCYLFFEPGFYDSYYPVGIPGLSSFGSMLITYGDYIGIPFFYLLIAFLITAIITCIPLSFSLRHDINLPNFIYGACICAGVSLTYVLGIIFLWQFGLFVVFTVFTIIIKYKDTLEATVPWRGKHMGEIKLSPYGSVKKTEGIASGISHRIKRPLGVTTPEWDWMPEHHEISQASPRQIDSDFNVVYDNAKERQLRQDLQRERESKGLGYPSSSTSKVTWRGLTDAEHDALHPERMKKTRKYWKDYYETMEEVMKKKRQGER